MNPDQLVGLATLIFLIAFGSGLWLLLDLLTGGDRP